MSRRERWRVIRNFTNYEVSDRGRIRRRETGHILVQSERKNGGHMVVTLYRRRKGFTEKKTERVNRLVLLAFRSPCPRSKPYATHRDGNPANNVLNNLRWANQKTNAADAKRHGTWTHGTMSGVSPLSASKVKAIRRRYAAGGISQAALAKKYGVVQSAIWQIVNGVTWAHL